MRNITRPKETLSDKLRRSSNAVHSHLSNQFTEQNENDLPELNAKGVIVAGVLLAIAILIAGYIETL